MARKTLIYTVTDEGRDKGRVFLLTEMPARQAERWGMRAVNIMSKGKDGFNPALLSAGMAGVAAMGVSAFAAGDWREIEPLMDEMFTCIQAVPDPAKPNITRPLIDDDTEEVLTRAMLRQEVLELHLGFFKAAVNWILTAARQGLQQAEAEGSTPNMSTSPAPLAR